MSDCHAAETPLVSVVIPTYCRSALLRRAVQSILDQTFRSFEVIVVNDAGADVEPVLRSLSCGETIRHVAHPVNLGPAASRNSGIRAARGKYIAYLDDDDVYYPDHLEALVQLLERGEFRVAYTDACRVRQAEREGEWVTTDRDVPYSWEFDADEILESNYVPILCVMHDVRCVEEVGLFDETLPALEDLDLWIRVSRKYAFAHIPRVTCEFTWHSEAASESGRYKYDFSEVLPLLYRKYELNRKEVRQRNRIKALESELGHVEAELERTENLWYWFKRQVALRRLRRQRSNTEGELLRVSDK